MIVLKKKDVNSKKVLWFVLFLSGEASFIEQVCALPYNSEEEAKRRQ